MKEVISVNFHVNKACNAKCRFCYATFRDVPGQVDTQGAKRIIDLLVDEGCEKLNFAGGEPTLRKDIGVLVRSAKRKGLTTSIVTNGFRLNALLDENAEYLDWVGLSIDSGIEKVEVKLGRSKGRYLKEMVQLAERCKAEKIRVKLNTVVTALTWREDMSEIVRAIDPERWKVFQVLPIEGQNDGKVEELLISSKEFQHFVDLHHALEPIVEDNDAMKGSYVMIDPKGRFFGNSTGRLVYSTPILDVGIREALSQVGFKFEKLRARGGTYEW